ncbi:MAG: hypothetical protein Q9162_002837 [Coniocarpon cinnabarinum]
MLFFSFFKTLVDTEVTVELKNDISIQGTLKSVDQYLNIKLDDISVIDELKYPHLNASRLANDQIQPSIGRPPSPPELTPRDPDQKPIVEMAVSPLQPAKLNTELRSTQSPAKGGKPKPNGNASILSFFKKSDNPAETAGLFVQQAQATVESTTKQSHWTGEQTQRFESGNAEQVRFNEYTNAVKRRKTSQETSSTSNNECVAESASTPGAHRSAPQVDVPRDNYHTAQSEELDRRRSTPEVTSTAQKPGPFIDQSDSEDESEIGASRKVVRATEVSHAGFAISHEAKTPLQNDIEERGPITTPSVPLLKREGTSLVEQDGFADFEGMEDFEDEYEDGEEFVERRYMEEQRRLEAQAGVDNGVDDEDFTSISIKKESSTTRQDPADREQAFDNPSAPSCPICNVSLGGITSEEASVHVNNCLDGNPSSLPPAKRENVDEEAEIDLKPKRFVRPPKPGQQNPFVLGQAGGRGSAFNKLMSGHTEENAWSVAAASERDARGKPAYQRTCPFYKILPGFYTCVDAFRYGAVSGCNAYFLSHFHSDHYVGLTSNWSHGKIYCSRITANLVRQQLRVDPKWVVDLEWEQKVEVPGTEGVSVTMIPANHCPGSSIYLFEKTLPAPKNAPSTAKPRTQRVLHCGDFRACPAHIAHPLLAPEILDNVTGKLKHQKIDICYLDTTYLSPKYAFPSQEEVIEACADMCVSLSKEKVDHNDSYETMKRERAGTAMTKFVRKDSKEGEISTDSPTKEGGSETRKKPRGQLLVVVGTYSIGKERICLGIARALDSLIYAPPSKQRICAALHDQELNKRLTSDPLAASVHMTPLFEIRAETLSEYLETYNGHFGRAVGFRPSGWNYRPPGSRSTEAPTVQQVLYSPGWKSTYGMKNLMPQRGSSNKASVYGVPYSEHSSFRELSMFVCGLRIEKVIPTVNVGSAKSRERMRAWCERWAAEKRKNGLFRVRRPEDEEQLSQGTDDRGEFYPGRGTWELRTTL